MEAYPEGERMGTWLNLLQAHAVVTAEIERRLQAEFGLSVAEHEVLVRLRFAPDGRLRMHELADLLLVSKSGVTRIVDRVERMGLVKREADADDRRVTHAVLTHAGARTLDRALPLFTAAIEETFGDHLNETDVRAMRKALRKVLAGNGAWEEQRCSPTYGEAATG